MVYSDYHRLIMASTYRPCLQHRLWPLSPNNSVAIWQKHINGKLSHIFSLCWTAAMRQLRYLVSYQMISKMEVCWKTSKACLLGASFLIDGEDVCVYFWWAFMLLQVQPYLYLQRQKHRSWRVVQFIVSYSIFYSIKHSLIRISIDIYLGMELAVVPTALAEFSPPRYRGAMVSLYWLSVKVCRTCRGYLPLSNSDL